MRRSDIEYDARASRRGIARAPVRTGVAIDWRVIGGTSEIARFLEGEYVASFKAIIWTGKTGKREWST